jgi:S-DNA-T family DNA segregation ATPase FtsK/SpoIIIE
MGPTVTRYELQLQPGIRVSKVVSLSDDIAMALAAQRVRIEAPIPGKSAIGIEVPNKEIAVVKLSHILASHEFTSNPSPLAVALGKMLSGEVLIMDITKMPHILIAGETGSGKSVCLHTIIMSILYHSAPDDVRIILIDPKMVEFPDYNDIPHLLIPVVTDAKLAASSLAWAVREMTSRYESFAENKVRDINGYNEKMEKEGGEKLPRIVLIIDELNDLMMVSAQQVENSICRLAQLARAAGIHLVLATQRPSVNVITGLIKANIPSRISFSVSSQTDSRTILDMGGAEKLLGKGDMLYYPSGESKPMRAQCAYISEKEISKVVAFIKKDQTAEYDAKVSESIENASAGG